MATVRRFFSRLVAMQTRLIGDVFRNQDDGRRIGRVLGQIDVRKPELMGQRLGNLLLGGEVHPHEHHTQAIACSLVLGQGNLQIGLADQPGLDETFTDFFTHAEPRRLPAANPQFYGRLPP